MRVLVACIAVLGCGKGGSAGSGSGSAAPGSAVATADAAVAAVPAAKLLDDEQTSQPELMLAFDKHVPLLPALSADGAWLARFDSDSMEPMFPYPVFVSIEPVYGAGKTERLEIVEMTLATNGPDDNWAEKPPSAAVAKHVRDNGKAVMARLKGFGSLVKVDVDTNNGDPKPKKIGDLVLASTQTDDKLVVTLSDAGGKVLHHERVKAYESDEHPASFAGGACSYTPRFNDAYTDQAKQKLYVFIGFHFNEECTPPGPQLTVWPLSKTAPTSDIEALGELLTNQFDLYGTMTPDSVFTPDAQLIFAGDVSKRGALPFHAVAANETYSGHDDNDDDLVVVARDGKTAWGTVTTKLSLLPKTEPKRDDPWRASSMFVKTPAGWRIAATTWSRPLANAKANKDAKAGKLASSPAFTGDAGDAGLRAAFAKLVSDGVDADAAARTNLVAIGSADGERTVGGKAFATGWNAGWKGRATIISSIARLAPSGTTGWVAANVELAKPGYKIPFHLFCVFDKTAGAWSLVHVHFAI